MDLNSYEYNGDKTALSHNLIFAIKNQNLEFIKKYINLIDVNAYYNFVEGKNEPKYNSNNHMDRQFNINPFEYYSYRLTLLDYAVYQENREKCKLLVRASSVSVPIILILLENGLHPDTILLEGISVLQYACAINSNDLFTRLIELGANIYLSTRISSDVLEFVLKYYIKCDIHLNDKILSQYITIDIKKYANFLRTNKYLCNKILERYLTYPSDYEFDNNILYSIIYNISPENLKGLLKVEYFRKLLVERISPSMTFIQKIIHNNQHTFDIEMFLKLLMENNISFTETDQNGANYLHYVAGYMRDERAAANIVQSLLSKGIDINHLTVDGKSVLYYYLRLNYQSKYAQNSNFLQFLIDCGANVNNGLDDLLVKTTNKVHQQTLVNNGIRKTEANAKIYSELNVNELAQSINILMHTNDVSIDIKYLPAIKNISQIIKKNINDLEKVVNNQYFLPKSSLKLYNQYWIKAKVFTAPDIVNANYIRSIYELIIGSKTQFNADMKGILNLVKDKAAIYEIFTNNVQEYEWITVNKGEHMVINIDTIIELIDYHLSSEDFDMTSSIKIDSDEKNISYLATKRLREFEYYDHDDYQDLDTSVHMHDHK